MRNLYIDFDGVIVDTIRVTYDMLDRLEVDKTDFSKMSEFYSNLNWKQLLSLTSIINDSFKWVSTPLTNSIKEYGANYTHFYWVNAKNKNHQ